VYTCIHIQHGDHVITSLFVQDWIAELGVTAVTQTGCKITTESKFFCVVVTVSDGVVQLEIFL
jgi:hypothetical protein